MRTIGTLKSSNELQSKRETSWASRFVLTLVFDKLLTPKFVFATIGFELGLTVAFVAAVDRVTRFFVLFPVWVTLTGFLAFCVVAGALRVVAAFLPSATAGDAVTSRLCWRLWCLCSCSLTRSRARTSRIIRDTASSSQMFGNFVSKSLATAFTSFSSDCHDKTTKWSTNMNFTRFFTHIFTSDYFSLFLFLRIRFSSLFVIFCTQKRFRAHKSSIMINRLGTDDISLMADCSNSFLRWQSCRFR